MTEEQVVEALKRALNAMVIGWPQDDWDAETNQSIAKVQSYLDQYKGE